MRPISKCVIALAALAVVAVIAGPGAVTAAEAKKGKAATKCVWDDYPGVAAGLSYDLKQVVRLPKGAKATSTYVTLYGQDRKLTSPLQYRSDDGSTLYSVFEWRATKGRGKVTFKTTYTSYSDDKTQMEGIPFQFCATYRKR